jgi:hypothetical protein
LYIPVYICLHVKALLRICIYTNLYNIHLSILILTYIYAYQEDLKYEEMKCSSTVGEVPIIDKGNFDPKINLSINVLAISIEGNNQEGVLISDDDKEVVATSDVYKESESQIGTLHDLCLCACMFIY